MKKLTIFSILFKKVREIFTSLKKKNVQAGFQKLASFSQWEFEILASVWKPYLVDQERAELQVAIKECEEAIKKQENKSMEAQIELSKVKQEAESKILAKNHMIAEARKVTGAELDNSQGTGHISRTFPGYFGGVWWP